MSRILLSIKPEYVDKILSGTKKFEFRKHRCARNIETIVIYSTNPVMRIVGEVAVHAILESNKDTIWEQTKDHSGISKQFFDAYFKDHQTAIAYQLGEIKIYKRPMLLHELGIKAAPQSFLYLD